MFRQCMERLFNPINVRVLFLLARAKLRKTPKFDAGVRGKTLKEGARNGGRVGKKRAGEFDAVKPATRRSR